MLIYAERFHDSVQVLTRRVKVRVRGRSYHPCHFFAGHVWHDQVGDDNVEACEG